MKEVLLIAFSIGFLLSITIIVNNNRWQKPKFWLGMLILAFSLILLDAWGSIIELSELIPIFGYTHYRCLMMIPICLWMYINGLVNFNKVQIGTFEKVLFGFLFFELFLLALLFVSEKIIQTNYFLTPSTIIENQCVIISMIVMWKANQVLNTFKERIRNNYTDGLEQSYNWLKEFFFVLSSLLPIWAFVVNAYFFIDLDVNVWYQIIWIPLSILIFYIVIRASSTKEILHNFELETGFNNDVYTASSDQISDRSGIHVDNTLACKLMPNLGELQIVFDSNIPEKDKELLTLLIHIVNEKKLFRIKRLNIKDCAQLTGIVKKEISRLVNHYLQLSFSDFINLFRIEDFRYKVSKGEAERFSLVAIALESGFSSKSNVYYNFKKLTNSSPIQVVNQYKIASKK